MARAMRAIRASFEPAPGERPVPFAERRLEWEEYAPKRYRLADPHPAATKAEELLREATEAHHAGDDPAAFAALDRLGAHLGIGPAPRERLSLR